jgi:CHASE2 domain-containing sensor protein/class 3 adenylate cyclase
MDSSQDELNRHPLARVFGRVRKRFQSLGNRALGICAAIAVVVCILEVLHLPPLHPELSDAELRLQDHYFLLRNYLWPNGSWKTLAYNDIVLVSVDSESARRVGLSDNQQWRKKIYASLVKKLREAHADVIVLDVPLDVTSELKSDFGKAPPGESAKPSIIVATDTANGESDSEFLIYELTNSKNVVLTSGIDRGPANNFGASRDDSLVLLRSPGTPFVDAVGEDSGSIGNNVIVADSDGIVRHGTMLFDQLGPSFYKSIALRVIEKKIGARSIVDDHGTVYLRDRLMPANVRINYAGPPGSFRVIPLWRALEWEKHAQHGWFSGVDNLPSDAVAPGAQNLLAQNPFKNKIVLIGMFDPAASESSRERSTYGSSVSNFLTPAAPPPTPMVGVEIQANLIANTLHRTFLAEPDQWELLLLIIFVGLLVGRVLGFCAYRPWLSLAAMGLISILWLAVSFYAFVAMKILIPVVVPLIGAAWPATALVLLDQHYKIKREKAKQIKLFRSLAARPLANEIERRLLAELGLTGKLMNVTVAACQLHDFSLDITERSPEIVLQSLNECLAEMMASIGANGGLVERVWNCGVIGLWGAPIAMDQSAQVAAAAKCMGDMRQRLRRLNNNEQNSSKSPYGLTCSINTGEAICGTIDAGSRDSSLVQYGALGPTVDLAMRLDLLNSKYGTTCIIGAATAKLLEDQAELRELDRLTLGANEENQSVYELLSVDGALPGIFEESMDLFRQGRTAFEDGHFREAKQLFATALSMVPNDKATAIMLERCRNVLSKSDQPI